MSKSTSYNHKIVITLSLTEEQASDLLETLQAGANARYAPGLQRRSNEIKALVTKRYDAAIMARRARRLRADQRAMIEANYRQLNDRNNNDV